MTKTERAALYARNQKAKSETVRAKATGREKVTSEPVYKWTPSGGVELDVGALKKSQSFKRQKSTFLAKSKKTTAAA